MLDPVHVEKLIQFAVDENRVLQFYDDEVIHARVQNDEHRDLCEHYRAMTNAQMNYLQHYSDIG